MSIAINQDTSEIKQTDFLLYEVYFGWGDRN